MDDHMTVWAAETAALEPTSGEAWMAAVEKVVGYDLDGDQGEDGYSLDFAYQLFHAGETVEAAAKILSRGPIRAGDTVARCDDRNGARYAVEAVEGDRVVLAMPDGSMSNFNTRDYFRVTG